jgi:outer membrane protein OmpA-like peptidoglycan-associated protein
MIVKSTFISLLLMFGSASAEQFQAPVTHTKWEVTSSPLTCTLSQDIPDFGQAKFTKDNGNELSLIFDTYFYPATQNNAAFEIAEAPWQNSEQRFHLLSVPTEKGQTHFELTGPLADQALTQMQEGRFPALRYQSKNSTEQISALLSTVHLADSIVTFQKCLINLHPDTFEDMRKLTVHFALESANLGSATKKALNRLAAYIKIDESITRIKIIGHTDNHGRNRLNGPLSEQRSASVKNYLVELGVPEALIITSAYRERKPKTSNKTQAGRAINRRAEIELFR